MLRHFRFRIIISKKKLNARASIKFILFLRNTSKGVIIIYVTPGPDKFDRVHDLFCGRWAVYFFPQWSMGGARILVGFM